MTSAFISYSRRDKTIAEHIVAELRNRGADLFIDYQNLVAGENFIKRLGHEIQKRDYFVILLSANSIASKWVLCEAMLAVDCHKMIIPVELEPVSLVDFFFLMPLEKVDFTGWSSGAKVEGAVYKLAHALKLPAMPIRNVSRPQIIVNESSQQETDLSITPTFTANDLADLFSNAIEIAEKDSERGLFLYHRLLEIDPNYARGQARMLAEREENRLKSKRLALMKTKADDYMRKGQWSHAEKTVRDMLALDANHLETKNTLYICVQYANCEALYEQAKIAQTKGRHKAALSLVMDVFKQCPNYGDPEGLLGPIQVDYISFVREIAQMAVYSGDHSSVAFSPDGRLLASSYNNTVHLWSVKELHGVAVLKGHSGMVNSVMFSPDGRLIASGSYDGTIRLWSVESLHEVALLKGFGYGLIRFLNDLISYLITGKQHDARSSINSVTFSSDGRLLATVNSDNMVCLWSVEKRRNVAAFDGHDRRVNSVAFSPDGRLLASCGHDYTVRLWSVEKRRNVATFHGNNRSVNSVAFSPDGRLLASCGDDHTVRLWSVEKRREVTVLTGHSGNVNSVAFSPDGRLLASCGDDHTVRLWSVEKGREMTVLRGHSGNVNSVTFSPDGRLLASSDNLTVCLWGF